jgi:hypothetical protein
LAGQIELTLDFIHDEVYAQHFEISLHADDERMADGLTLAEVEEVLLRCRIIEHYPADPRGESCLVAGLTEAGIPVHVVCGRNPAGRLVLVTVYIPAMPKWKDWFTRNR